MMPSRGRSKYRSRLTSTNYNTTTNEESSNHCDVTRIVTRNQDAKTLKESRRCAATNESANNSKTNMMISNETTNFTAISRIKMNKNVIETMQFSKFYILVSYLACLLSCHRVALEVAGNVAGATLGAPGSLGELVSLGGQLGGSVRLPCLIGRQFNCGEPYFIAWYKLNPNKPLGGWTRIEYVTGQASPAAASSRPSFSQDHQNSLISSISNQGDERQQLTSDVVANQTNRFTFFRGPSSGASCESLFVAGATLTPAGSSPAAPNPFAKRLATSELECAQLEINKLELSDEGQYKCEITFSESLEVDKCPPSSVSRLTVIARPKEPELLLNGRLVTAAAAANPVVFKEGAQIRLECQSSGGKPAPRVEWLNVTTAASGGQALEFDSLGEHDAQLIRSQRKSSNGVALISSSSILISLSRYDLASHFVCLVMPDANLQHLDSGRASSSSHSHFWLRMLQRAANKQQQQPQQAMLKSIKFDIQVKPSTVSLVVRDPLRNVSLAPVSWQAESTGFQQQAAAPPQASFFSLQLNHLYLVQCVVDGSRPASQVAWFNKTAPIGADPVSLTGAEGDFEVPTRKSGHRLSSFVRQIAQEDGTFRTVGSLLLTTNIWDNYEELFCRVSNEAFQFEELTSQVLPILSAGLYVNYAPFARLELDNSAPASEVLVASNDTNNSVSVRLDEGSSMTLRCLVGANPLGQASILQIEWLKDNQKLEQSSRGDPQAGQHFTIERANQLHMGASQQANQNKQFLIQFQEQQNGQHSSPDSSQLLASSKLLAISTLQLKPVSRPSAGTYSCQFKIIPAPGPALAIQQTNNNKILSGRSKQSVLVKVAEAKPKAPTLRIQSAAGLLAYKPAAAAAAAPLIELQQQAKNSNQLEELTILVAPELHSSISLRCETQARAVTPPTPTTTITTMTMASLATNKISWFANGIHLHSSSTSDTLNVTLASLLNQGRPINNRAPLNQVESENLNKLSSSLRLSCSHQVVLAPSEHSFTSFHANQIRHIPSSNELDLRLAVKPELQVARPDLMPPLRSFSELELDSSPSEKLKLSCMASCEPLCSLNWFINSHQLLPRSQQQQQINENRVKLAKTTTSSGENGNVVLRRLEDLALSSDFADSVLIMQEIISTKRHVNGSTAGGWIYEALLGEKSSFAGEPRTLKRALGDSLEPSNVFSSLELTYNQIKILLAKYNDDLTIKCAISDQTSLHNPWAFKYQVVAPNEWFPSAANYEPDLIDDSTSNKQFQQFNFKSAAASTRLNQQLQTRITIDKPPRDVKLTFDSILGPEVSPFGLSVAENQLIEFSDPNKPRPVFKCLVSGSPATKFKWTFTHLNGTEELLYVEGNELDFRQTIELRQRQNQANPSSAYGYDVVSSLSGNYTCIASNKHGFKASSLPVQIHGRPLCKLTLDGERLNPEDKSLTADLKCSVYSIPQALETVWFRGSRELATNRSDPIESLMSSIVKDKTNPLSAFKLTIPILNKDQDFLQADLATSPEINYKCLVKNSLGYSEICELPSSHRQVILNILKRDLNLADQSTSSSTASNRQATATSSMMWPLANWPIFSHTSNEPTIIGVGNNNDNINQQLQQQQQQQHQLAHNGVSTMVVRYDLIALGAICCIVLVYLSVLILTTFVHKIRGIRRFKGSLNCDPNTNWHFSSTERRNCYGVNNNNATITANSSGNIMIDAHKTMQTSASAIINQRLVSKPLHHSTFQSSMIGFGATAANYYGGSNGDSEHDMIQSCSQSSQYEDLLGANSSSNTTTNNNNNNGSSGNTTNNISIQGKPISQNYQSQALYFNHELASSAATMNNRRSNTNNNNNNQHQFIGNGKSTLASSRNHATTTITANEMHPNTQLVRLDFDNNHNNTSRLSSRFQTSNNKKLRQQQQQLATNELILGKSRVPLIDGTQTSRIKLDDERYNNYATTTTNGIHLQRIEPQDANALQQEHIYDDVIYKKNIL